MPLHPHIPALTGISITAGSVACRHFIVDPTLLVQAALQSAILTNPSLVLDAKNKIVHLNEQQPENVSIISGGGSGHEPVFAAFVGRGLLTAAVTGNILASPDAEQVRIAIVEKCNRKKGILAIIMNNQGDVQNFKTAIARAKASGIKVELVIVGDDVGRGRSMIGTSGRSGIAGTVLVLKIAGALAASGASLEEVTRIAELASDNLQSVGVSLSHAHIPNHPLCDAKIDEYLATEQIGARDGMGIYKAHGSNRVTVDLPGIIKDMLRQLLDWGEEERSFCRQDSSDELVLLVNNLGGLSGLELGGITTETSLQLQSIYAIKPIRILSGTYMSSLNEIGFSISLLKVVDPQLLNGIKMLELLSAPVEASGWVGGGHYGKV